MQVTTLKEMVAQRVLGVSSASTEELNIYVAMTFVFFLAKDRGGLI